MAQNLTKDLKLQVTERPSHFDDANMMSQYIYLLKEREFIKTKEDIYKVGMTRKENHARFNQYPKSSLLLFQMICDDCSNVEKQVIKLFKKYFKQRKDIGNEYFEGDYKSMINHIYVTIQNENSEHTIEDTSKDTVSHTEPDDEDAGDQDGSDDAGDDNANHQQDGEEKDYVPYVITTYEEWIKYTNIDKIIVTNKNGEGYLRFKGQMWKKLHDKTRFDFDETCMEVLSEFVERNQPDVCKMVSPGNTLVSHREMINFKCNYEHKVSNQAITYDEYHKLDEKEQGSYKYVRHDEYEFNCDVRFDVGKITQDAIKKCYVKSCDFHNLEYHEYSFARSGTQPHSPCQYVIFNSVNFTFTPVDDLIDSKILTGRGSWGRIIHVKNAVNVDIVDDILKSLIADTKITQQFKKIAHNLIVKHEEPQVFYDYNDCLLTTWIKDLLYSISGKRLHVDSSEYYDDKKEFKKELKTCKCRLVVIHAYQNITFEKQVEDFSKLGFKNIIVCKKDKSNAMYNVATFRKYLEDNAEIIMKCINEENNYEPASWETEIQHDDNIFYRTDLLFTNFLKWCCVK